MSKESLDQFMNQVADSEELQARIGEEIDAETLISLGAEHGCEFTADDLTENSELSDEELDSVTGGLISVVCITTFKGPNIRCKVRPASGRCIDDASSN